jgi:hypothetical protein
VEAIVIPHPRTRETIASRFRAGDSVAELAHDYDQPTEAIEAAIREEDRDSEMVARFTHVSLLREIEQMRINYLMMCIAYGNTQGNYPVEGGTEKALKMIKDETEERIAWAMGAQS